MQGTARQNQGSRADKAAESYRGILKGLHKKAARASENLEDLTTVIDELEPAERGDLVKRAQLATHAAQMLAKRLEHHSTKELAADPAATSLPWLEGVA